MKNTLFVIALFIGISASAQDSSRFNINLNLKQKSYALTKSYADQFKQVQDVRFIDSLLLHMGSNSPATADSLSISVWKAGRFLQFFLQVMDERAGPVFKYIDDLINSTQAANGYTGILQQLNQKINNNTVDKPAATWLKGQILDWNQRFTNVFNERISNAKTSGAIDFN